MKYYKRIGGVGYISKIPLNKVFEEADVPEACIVKEYVRLYPEDWQEVLPSEYFVQESKLPENYIVECDNAQETTIVMNSNGNYNKQWGWWKYCYTNKNDITGLRITNNIKECPSDYPLFTFEQWNKIINKTMKENDKEIVGWKLKEDCKQFTEAIASIIKEQNIFPLHSGKTTLNYHDQENSIKLLKKAGVLDLWFEEVYGEVIPNITIKGYKAEFTDNSVKFGCQKYSKDFVITLSECLEENNFKMDYRDDIKQIAEYFINKK